MKILVTGGAGYIGSHTCVELLNSGYSVVVVDNLSNSNIKSLNRVENISGKNIDFYKIDLLNKDELSKVFRDHKFDAVMHFAALKAVGESVEFPLRYYHNNITGTLHLCELAKEFGVKDFVFSSSATVYGEPVKVPIVEDFPIQPTNPYGWTKAIMERILIDAQAAYPDWNIAILRYFNPVGAHPSGLIGEAPNDIPNNLMPYITQVAVGKRDELLVFGNDYPTPDGTGIRDYIHVVDLAQGHLAALKYLERNPGVVVYNLGAGRGYSVLEIIRTFEKVNGVKVPYKIVERRPGDIAISFADPHKANVELGWKAILGLDEICADSWRWQFRNPNGYDE